LNCSGTLIRLANRIGQLLGQFCGLIDILADAGNRAENRNNAVRKPADTTSAE